MRENTEGATILDGATTSGAVDLRSAKLKAIRLPAAWTTGTLTLKASTTLGGTYVVVKNMAGTTVSITATAATFIVIDPNALEGLPFVKFVANTATTGDQLIELLTEPRT